MRHLLIAILWASLPLSLTATETNEDDDKKAQPKKAEREKIEPEKQPERPPITLKVGDAPPPLIASKWYHGSEVKKFESGKAYVIEFWATWCPPCIGIMPHLSEIQKRYRDKGVTVIGYTSNGQDNSEEQVAEFIGKRGTKLGYTFAYSESRDSDRAWMVAAGQYSIPCTFVVGKDTKIAYIGHPIYLDIVLPKVAAGTWDAIKDTQKIDDAQAAVMKVLKSSSGNDAKAGLVALNEFEAKYPEIANFIAVLRLELLLKTDKVEEAEKFARSTITTALASENIPKISQFTLALIGPDAKKNKALSALALDSAEKLVKLVGDKDLGSQLTLAQTQFAADEKIKAKATAERILELAPQKSKALYKDELKEILGEELKKKPEKKESK